jgi:hypothetical protein
VIIPAQVPKIALPDPMNSRIGSLREKMSMSFEIVVDSPPGKINPEMSFRSELLRTSTVSQASLVSV